MDRLITYFKDWAYRIRYSIAFLPTAISLVFLVVGFILFNIQHWDAVDELEDQLSLLTDLTPETARTLLSTLTGGVISLLVFSFSMVMVVLNQATTNYSPRLLPSLISQRQHQFILGFYLGTIIFNLTVITAIGSPAEEINIPIMSVVLAMLFGITSLALFILFIHNISSAIRIDSILRQLYAKTKNGLESQMNTEGNGERLYACSEDVGKTLSYPIKSREAGYLLSIDKSRLLKIAKKNDLKIQVLPIKGDFIFQNQHFLSLNRAVEEKLAQKLQHAFRLSITEDISDDFFHGIHQIQEIAVKAMSPGINDPASAQSAVNYMTGLLADYLQCQEERCWQDSEGEERVYLSPRPIEVILFKIYAPLRCYGSHDAVFMQTVLRSLRHLVTVTGINGEARRAISREIKKLEAEVQEDVKINADVVYALDEEPTGKGNSHQS